MELTALINCLSLVSPYFTLKEHVLKWIKLGKGQTQ